MSRWRHLPNVITAARLALVLPLVWLMHGDQFRTAFWVAFAAGLSDALDGALAKGFGWQSRLGGLLDPLADKLLITACFVGLWSAGVLPGWLLALVIGRDLVIVAGALAYHGLIAPLEAAPSLASKATTAAQLGLALAGLTALAWPALDPGATIWQAAQGAVAVLTVASGLQYVWQWGGRAWRARHEGA
jgi:cardiolipin synthase